MIGHVSTDVVWGPASVSANASEIDEPRARGAYLDARLPWVLGVSLLGSVAVLFGSFFQYAAH